MRELKLRIADFVISVISSEDSNGFKVDDAYRGFITKIEPDAIFRVHYGRFPNCKLNEKIFSTETIWDLYQSKGKYILKVPSRMAVLESDFKSGNIYIESSLPLVVPSYPLQYPMDEVLIINMLSKGWGTMLHAFGASDSGRGLLFAGKSGAGKSTLCNLWKDKKNVTVLSDDRIIVRKMEDRFWVYGTPWHGDAKACSPEKAPLEKIFFLKHADKNEIKKISPIDATSRMIVCSFPTFWDKKGMEFTLNFCAELAGKVPCYELGFVPGKTVIDFVKDI
jgi:hypothetical protein